MLFARKLRMPAARNGGAKRSGVALQPGKAKTGSDETLRDRSPGAHFVLMAVISLAVVAALLSGCRLRDMRQQSETVSQVARIDGRVESAVDGTARVLLTVSRPDGDSLANMAELGRDGGFTFYAEPGTYFLSAYVDRNGDGIYESGEPAAINSDDQGVPIPLELGPGASMTVPALRIEGPLPGVKDLYSEEDVALATRNVGRVVQLSEALFSRENASLGMWRPMDYLERFGGGLFFLEPYDAHRQPVVFVHGINGTALDFEPVLDGLDRDRYQPWVLQYPSGVDLDIISNYFLRALDTLHERHGFGQVMIVAHSMGGVMTRAMVLKATRQPRPWSLSLVVTVASPLLGMPSAAQGVEHSPIVVPSWRDLAPGSDFLTDLHANEWPRDVPWQLVFTYRSGQHDDGVVPLDRQIDPRLQDEAMEVFGVNATHVGVLGEEDFLIRLGAWLDRAATRR